MPGPYISYREWRAEWVTCEKCGARYAYNAAYSDSERDCFSSQCRPAPVLSRWGRRINAQVGEGEATAVAVKRDADGNVIDVSYCFDRPDAPLSEEWKREGFEKVQFHSYRELERFCRQQGVVNDIEGDYHKDDGYFEEYRAGRDKFEKDRRERYLEERARVKRGMR